MMMNRVSNIVEVVTDMHSRDSQLLLHGKMKSAMYVGSLCVCVCVCICLRIIKNVSEFVRSLASQVLEI